MSDRSSIDDEHRAHLERSERVWNRRSAGYGRSEREMAPMMADAVERLDLDAGDAVLEVGCGPGTNLERLRERVGERGRVVAVDYSPEMCRRARERYADRGWDNVGVVRADASRLRLDQEFDAALASLSLSVMPDVRAAAERIQDALVPSARLVVFDVRPVPSGPLRIVNPLLAAFLRWYANWNADEDALAAVRETFDNVSVERTYFTGTLYTAVAERD